MAAATEAAARAAPRPRLPGELDANDAVEESFPAPMTSSAEKAD